MNCFCFCAFAWSEGTGGREGGRDGGREGGGFVFCGWVRGNTKSLTFLTDLVPFPLDFVLRTTYVTVRKTYVTLVF